MKDRIYISHTYYHVYVTFFKRTEIKAEGRSCEESRGCYFSAVQNVQ